MNIYFNENNEMVFDEIDYVITDNLDIILIPYRLLTEDESILTTEDGIILTY